MLNSILTIDQATRSGFCNWKPGNKPVLSALDLGYCNGDLGYIMSAFERHVRTNLKENNVDYVCFETPLLMPKDTIDNLRRLYGFVAIIEKLCHNLKIPCYEVAVPTWRKTFLQTAQLKKKVAKDRCMIKCDQIGLKYEGHDECEAFGIMDNVAMKESIPKDWPEPAGLRFTQ